MNLNDVKCQVLVQSGKVILFKIAVVLHNLYIFCIGVFQAFRGTVKGTEQKRTIPFFQKELNGTRKETKSESVRSVPFFCCRSTSSTQKILSSLKFLIMLRIFNHK